MPTATTPTGRPDPTTMTKPELVAECRQLNIRPRGGLSRAAKPDLVNWVQMNRPRVQTPPPGPAILRTEPSPDGSVTLVAEQYVIHLGNGVDRDLPQPNRARIFVAAAVAEARDAELRDLAEREWNLGEDRELPTGINPEIDALYAALNARYEQMYLDIAREVLPLLAGLVHGDLDRAVAESVFDRSAGCLVQGRCLCAPGVVAGRLMYHWDTAVICVGPPTALAKTATS